MIGGYMLHRPVTIVLFAAIVACGRIGYEVNRVDVAAGSGGSSGMS
jgi:hypothetical protein